MGVANTPICNNATRSRWRSTDRPHSRRIPGPSRPHREMGRFGDLLLRFICTKEVCVTERGDDVLVVVEDFIEHAVVAPHIEKHDDVLVGSASFAMDIARRGGLVHARRTSLLERAVGFIQPMLALHDEGVVVDHMPVQNDLFVCREFEQYMDDVALFIDVQYRKE
jgi:hypothetical protein